MSIGICYVPCKECRHKDSLYCSMCELTYRRQGMEIPTDTIDNNPLTLKGLTEAYVESLNTTIASEMQARLFEHIDATFDRIMKECIENYEHE